mgnify:CR=1 FL=1
MESRIGNHIEFPNYEVDELVEIAKVMSKRCDGRHEHVRLMGKQRTEAAARYPRKLCIEVCRGLRKQIAADLREGNAMCAMAEEHPEKFWDDVKGGFLDPSLVRAARAREMEYVKKMEEAGSLGEWIDANGVSSYKERICGDGARSSGRARSATSSSRRTIPSW